MKDEWVKRRGGKIESLPCVNQRMEEIAKKQNLKREMLENLPEFKVVRTSLHFKNIQIKWRKVAFLNK